MRPNGWACAASLVLAVAATPAWAHHSDSVFNRALTSRLEGVVKAFAIINPHSWLDLLVVDAQGGQHRWSLQTAGPDQLERAGWKAQAVNPGDRVKAVFHPSDDGSNRGELVTLTLADGQVLGTAVPSTAKGPGS